jgi:hypothetical protein
MGNGGNISIVCDVPTMFRNSKNVNAGRCSGAEHRDKVAVFSTVTPGPTVASMRTYLMDADAYQGRGIDDAGATKRHAMRRRA